MHHLNEGQPDRGGRAIDDVYMYEIVIKYFYPLSNTRALFLVYIIYELVRRVDLLAIDDGRFISGPGAYGAMPA